MNTGTVKQEITNIIEATRESIRHARQHAVSKKYIAELTELGLIEFMPANFGNTDAQAVIIAAKDNGGKQIGEGDTATSSDASKLFQLLNEVEEVAIEVAKPVSLKIGQLVRVVPHTQYSDLSQGTVTSWMSEHRHNGYQKATIVAMFEDGSVEVEVNQFGDIDMVDISHLEALV